MLFVLPLNCGRRRTGVNELKLTNSVSKNGRQMRFSKALFDMFNILVEPTDETEIQIIGRPPQRRLFPFVGSPLLPTNL